MPGVCKPVICAKLTSVMKAFTRARNSIVTALLAVVMISLPFGGARAADQARLDELFGALKEAEASEAIKIAREIELEFSKSGSATMDLLLKRGQDALEAGRTKEAIEHLTALIDHAPEFSEGYFYRAMAFLHADRFGPALADLERTLALTPRHYEAIGALGYMLEEMNRLDMAHDAYSRVLDIHPHHEEVLAALDRLKPQLSGKDL